MLTPAMMLTLAAAGTTGYTPAELARICACDILAERDVRRLAMEWAGELEADRVESDERQWAPWECPRTDSEDHELKNGG